jgi:predicted alpha-1,2-mannosidase
MNHEVETKNYKVKNEEGIEVMKRLLQFIFMLLLINSVVRSQDMLQYAITTCGTSGKGFTYPGAAAPFGMIQWSPDTGPGIRKGGYAYEDSIVYGFSVDHMSGAGCTYAGNFLMTPMLNTSDIKPPISRTDFPSTFSHVDEVAKPGYYAMTLNKNIRVELTARTRSGFGRFTFPSGSNASILINAGSNVRGTTQSSVKIDTTERSISGSSTGGHFCGGPDVTTTYFYALFSSRFSSYGTWNNDSLMKSNTDGSGMTSGAFVTFDKSGGSTILVRVAISYIGVANAKLNLETEFPDSSFTTRGFDNAADADMNTWNTWLNKIQVSGGTTDEMKTFYSMMYHTLLAPTVCSDVDGRYMGYDGIVHTTTNGRVHYANFSGWDIYRSECQLLGMIAPDEASDMAQSLLIDYQQGGAFPRWGVPNQDSGIMVGDPASPIIADFYAFGARNFDTTAALTGLIRAASNATVKSIRTNLYERDDLTDYLNLGYIPEGAKGGCVSITLEYASADFALSRFAFALGDSIDGNNLVKQAQSWQNLFNPETGYIQMRRRDGSWSPGFMDKSNKHYSKQAYVEGTAGQYVWMVPFDLRNLADKMGGDEQASKRLNKFFTEINGGFGSEYAYMGNEPSIGTPWIYDFLGKPYKTQEIVRTIVNELFSSAPGGCPGNDDLGTMGAWYIFSALGMYPELPGSDVLVLGSPLFNKSVLHLKNGDVIIIGNGAAENSPYIKSFLLNKQRWIKPWIRFSDISKGGELLFELSSTPDMSWGNKPEDAPPSYTN